MENPLRNLQKSVLIKNTMRLMKRELQENGAKKYRGYKRNHVAAIPYQRNKLRLQQQATSWEATVEGVYPKASSYTQPLDLSSSSKCVDKVAASQLEQSACQAEEGAFKETVLAHMMDISQPVTQDNQIATENSSAVSDSSNTDNEDKQEANSACEDCDKKQDAAYQSLDNSANDGLTSNSCAAHSHTRPDDHTSPDSGSTAAHTAAAIADMPDEPLQINGNHYDSAAVFKLHSHGPDSEHHFPPTLAVPAAAAALTSPLVAHPASVYAMYGLHYKHYYNAAAYAAYVHSLHQHHQNVTMRHHQQMLFSLNELMRNNYYAPMYSPVGAAYVAKHSDDVTTTDCSAQTEQMATSETSDADEDMFIDIMT